MSPPDAERGRPEQAASEVPTAIKTEESLPTRAGVEALIGSLVPGERLPLWVRWPADFTQFAAALLVLDDDVVPVYDAADRLVHFRGIRLRQRAS